jgi:hypothetical protein
MVDAQVVACTLVAAARRLTPGADTMLSVCTLHRFAACMIVLFPS